MSQEFQLPSIPKIFVPQSTFNIPQENESRRRQSKEVKEQIRTNESTTNLEKEIPFPQLCPSCSNKLLSYFVPFQKYINEIIEIAKRNANPSDFLAKTTSNQQESDFNQDSPTTQTSKTNNQSNAIVGQSSNQQSSNQNFNDQQNLQSTGQAQSNYDQNQIGQSNQSQSSVSGNSGSSSVSLSNFNSATNLSVAQNVPGQTLDNVYQTQTENDNNIQQQSLTLKIDDQNIQSANENTNEPSLNTDNKSSEKFVESSQEHVINFTPQDNETKMNESQTTENFQVPLNLTQESFNNLSLEEQNEESFNNLSLEEQNETTSQFAYVTIAYNNLSATNAILLANSLLLTNNKTLMLTNDQLMKRSVVQIPFVILIGGNIDPSLKEAIYMIFDEVIIQPMDIRLSLLRDESFGIHQNKIQLWRELVKYKKCLFLESSTLVVGQVTNLFEECEELSASVDTIFPDNFNCSVFVLEPSLMTYDQLINFALEHQKQYENRIDYERGGGLDEMTLLNCFFASKWKRISFIYNFIRNNEIYTQTPAFMKFGNSIRIVNFSGNLSISSNFMNESAQLPWHIMFDLLTSTQNDVISLKPIDNFSKFYLNIFLKRLWPLLQNHLTNVLISRYGMNRREWSIFELVRLLSNESGMETDDHIYMQTPLTLRRLKPVINDQDESSIEASSFNLLLSEHSEQEIDEVKEAVKILEKVKEDEKINEKINENKEKEEKGEPSSKKDEKKPPPKKKDPISGKHEWESGRIDWMGAHQSDKIIKRLKHIIKKN